jgi:hypothetical protein
VARRPSGAAAERRGGGDYFVRPHYGPTTLALWRGILSGSPGEDHAMRTITPPESKQIGATPKPHLNCLSRLRARMVEVGFLPTDPVFLAVVKAHDAAGELFMTLHYAGCGGGSGGARMWTAPKT